MALVSANVALMTQLLPFPRAQQLYILNFMLKMPIGKFFFLFQFDGFLNCVFR